MNARLFLLYDRRAAAIFLVLWALFVLSAALIVATRLVDRDLENESLANKRFNARLLALSGLAIASHPDVKPGSELLQKQQADNSGWEVRITSENSRININRLLEENKHDTLRAFFEHFGLKDREVAILVDSLSDWVDRDEFRSLNGAEASDIPLDSGWSRPENRPFLTVDEMQRVRGMEFFEEKVPGWREFFSTLSTNRFDLQFVGKDLLQVFGGLDEERAARFIKFRDGKDGMPGTKDDVIFETLEDAFIALGASQVEQRSLTEWFRVGGGLRRIESRGFVGRTSYTIECIKGEDGSIYLWKER